MKTVNQKMFLIHLVLILGVLAAWKGIPSLSAFGDMTSSPDGTGSLAAWQSAFQIASLKGAALMGILLALTQLFVHFGLSQPLRDLIKSLRTKVETGDFRPVPVRGHGEIAIVARSFNTLQNRLNRKVEDLNAFAANVSHEIKTPLTTALVNLELLERVLASEGADQEASPSLAEYVTRIKTELNRIEASARTVLAAAYDANITMQPLPVDIKELILAAAQSAQMKERIRFEGALREPAIFSVDSRHLSRAITNVLDNARAFAQPGSAVDVGINLTSQHNAVKEHTLQITIQNDGPWIPEQNLSKIFDRFFSSRTPDTVAEERRGYGIGLALARDVVEAHGGSISAENLAQGGVVFIITIPVLG